MKLNFTEEIYLWLLRIEQCIELNQSLNFFWLRLNFKFLRMEMNFLLDKKERRKATKINFKVLFLAISFFSTGLKFLLG